MQHRIDGLEEINPASIASHIAAGERVIVQFSQSGYSAQRLIQLNQLAKEHGRNFEIRFYGHYFEEFDASVLQFIPDAQCVSIDCLTSASKLETLSKIRGLAELSLGVFEMDDPHVLSYCNLQSLRVLSLGGTRKSNVDFRYLSGSKDLERRYTTGHTKNISTICSLPSLKALTLSSIKKKDEIEFVSSISSLKTLRLMLGGRASIKSINSSKLESLEIIRVQGLEEIGDIGRFGNLERLLIQDQIKLTAIKVGPNQQLKEMRLINCKAFEQIAGVKDLKKLSALQIYRTAIDYERFVSDSIPSELKTIGFCTGKSKRDAEIRTDLERRGFHDFAHS